MQTAEKYPQNTLAQTISNQELMKEQRSNPAWNTTISKRNLNWLGDLPGGSDAPSP